MANDEKVLEALYEYDGEVSNPDLRDTLGWTLVGEQRRRLNRFGYVESHKVGRCFVHTITGAGRAVSRFYGERQFADQVAAVGKQAEETRSPTAEDRIRTAVTDLLAARNAGRVNPATWVPLARLRIELAVTAGMTREDQDAALVSMFRDRTVAITPEDNRKALTDADHAAAIVIGGEAKHLVRFRTEEELAG